MGREALRQEAGRREGERVWCVGAQNRLPVPGTGRSRHTLPNRREEEVWKGRGEDRKGNVPWVLGAHSDNWVSVPPFPALSTPIRSLKARALHCGVS